MSSFNNLSFGTNFNLTVSKVATTNSYDFGWYGGIDSFKIIINAQYQDFSGSQILNFLFGEVELLYFFPLDSR